MATEYRYDPRADSPMAPGELIRETLEERGITQVDFALRLGKSEKFVSQLVNGKASLSYDTAIELERVLGVPSSTWNNWESIYRDALVRIRGEAEAVEQAEELYSYFGVSSIEAYQEYWSSEKRLAARMSTAYTAETPAITAWLREGERAAEAIPTAPYKEPVFREVLTELRSATRLAPNEWQPLIVDRCATAGVVVVFVPDLPKTRCHAVSSGGRHVRAPSSSSGCATRPTTRCGSASSTKPDTFCSTTARAHASSISTATRRSRHARTSSPPTSSSPPKSTARLWLADGRARLRW